MLEQRVLVVEFEDRRRVLSGVLLEKKRSHDFVFIESASSFLRVFSDLSVTSVPCVMIDEGPLALSTEVAKLALEAGADVFVMPPMAHSVREGLILTRLARKGERVLMVGHEMEYHPLFIEACQQQRRGELGTRFSIFSERRRLRPDVAGREQLRLLSNHLAMAIRFCYSGLPARLYAGRKDESVHVILEFDSGKHATIALTRYPRDTQGHRFMITGDKKSLYLDFRNNSIRGSAGAEEQRPRYRVPPLGLAVETFLAACANRLPVLADGQSGLAVLRLLEAAQWSIMREGEAVDLLPLAPLIRRPRDRQNDSRRRA